MLLKVFGYQELILFKFEVNRQQVSIPQFHAVASQINKNYSILRQQCCPSNKFVFDLFHFLKGCLFVHEKSQCFDSNCYSLGTSNAV